jgi:serine/threonine protein kinase
MLFKPPPPDEVAAALPAWTVREQLGKGTFKVAYRASFTGRTEALKLFFIPDFEDDDEGRAARDKFVARFERELRILKDCKTPHLVKLGKLEPTPVEIGRRSFIAYSEQLLEGKSVGDLIKSNTRPSETDVRKLLTALVAAIGELWRKHQCVHRDIKPANIMLNPATGAFVLLDLGVSFVVGGTRYSSGEISPGTPIYRAPEMLDPDYAGKLNARTDLYCAGVTAFEFASGQHPLGPFDDASSVTSRILRSPPQSLATLRPDLSAATVQIIDRLNRKTPALRGNLELIEGELSIKK